MKKYPKHEVKTYKLRNNALSKFNKEFNFWNRLSSDKKTPKPTFHRDAKSGLYIVEFYL